MGLKTQIDRNNAPRSSPRMRCSYINSSLSEYNVFFFFSSFLDYMSHFFIMAISLYSPLPLHPSLPPVDFVKNLLDACPIKTS